MLYLFNHLTFRLNSLFLNPSFETVEELKMIDAMSKFTKKEVNENKVQPNANTDFKYRLLKRKKKLENDQ